MPESASLMQHVRDLSAVQIRDAWLTIGMFDGVHRGHQSILRDLINEAHAQNQPAVVLTFHPHPMVVINRLTHPYFLTTPDERASLLAGMGVDMLITHPFNEEIASLPGRAFLERLNQHLHLRQLWVGYDFAMGHGRDTDANTLAALAPEMDFDFRRLPAFEDATGPISSRRIRNYLADGLVENAAFLLGRPYRVSGVVIPGDGRGRTIGVPTANISLPEGKIIPAKGVYACRAWLDDTSTDSPGFAAAVNIGTRPTFDGNQDTIYVEAHILDLNADLYGRTISLDFLSFLRGEMRFPSVNELVSQIRRDVQRTREVIKA